MKPRLVLAAATGREMKAALSRVFPGPGRPFAPPGQGQYLEVEINGRRVLVLVTGIGPVNAALGLGLLLGAESAPLAVLNMGLAGSFDLDKAPIRSRVLVTEEIWPEYGLVRDGRVDPMGLGFPIAYDPETGAVHDRIELKPELFFDRLKMDEPKGLIRGESLSVAGVSGDRDRAGFLRNLYHPLLENMEGFALALGCLARKIPFLELRTASNLVGSRSKQDWDLKGGLEELSLLGADFFSSLK